MAKFSVLIVARETRSVMKTVIGHYRRLGAEQIMIFFDGPTTPLKGLDAPGLEVIECNADFWAAHLEGNAPSIEDKQRVAHGIGLGRCRADWLLIVDADELLVADRPVEDMLDAVPADVDALRIPNYEMVWGPGDEFGREFGATYLRIPLRHRGRRALLRLVYGRDSRFLPFGLTGHEAGKQFIRAGRHYDLIDIHTCQRNGELIGQWLDAVAPGETAFIAHFDAVSLARWAEKFRRRYSGEAAAVDMRPSRAAQMDLIRDAIRSDDSLAGLCRRLNGLTLWQYRILRLFGYAFRRPVL